MKMLDLEHSSYTLWGIVLPYTSYMKSINTEALKKVMDQGDENILIVDIRSTKEHQGQHIPAVENIPMEDLEKHIETFKQYKQVYIHCNTGNRSTEACKRLATLDNVINVEGGLEAWKQAGFMTYQKAGHIPIIRQVHIVAGTLIL